MGGGSKIKRHTLAKNEDLRLSLSSSGRGIDDCGLIRGPGEGKKQTEALFKVYAERERQNFSSILMDLGRSQKGVETRKKKGRHTIVRRAGKTCLLERSLSELRTGQSLI